MSFMKSTLLPGDVVTARGSSREYLGPRIRAYSDPSCDTWDMDFDANTLCLVLHEHHNVWGQSVLTVLLPQGVRWVYKMDTESVF
jgi:hypothetical protein